MKLNSLWQAGQNNRIDSQGRAEVSKKKILINTQHRRKIRPTGTIIIMEPIVFFIKKVMAVIFLR